MKTKKEFEMTHGKIVTSDQYNGLPLYDGTKAANGFYEGILDSMSRMLTYHTEKYCRVLVCRFDLRYPDGYVLPLRNNHVSIFYDRLKQYLRRNGADPQLMWVREQHSSPNPHYHFLMSVQGIDYMNPKRIYNRALEYWGNAIGVSNPIGLLDSCNQAGPGHYHLYPREGAFQRIFPECFQRCSYMAKVATKGELPKGKHNCSGWREPKKK